MVLPVLHARGQSLSYSCWTHYFWCRLGCHWPSWLPEHTAGLCSSSCQPASPHPFLGDNLLSTLPQAYTNASSLFIYLHLKQRSWMQSSDRKKRAEWSWRPCWVLQFNSSNTHNCTPNYHIYTQAIYNQTLKNHLLLHVLCFPFLVATKRKQYSRTAC